MTMKTRKNKIKRTKKLRKQKRTWSVWKTVTEWRKSKRQRAQNIKMKEKMKRRLKMKSGKTEMKKKMGQATNEIKWVKGAMGWNFLQENHLTEPNSILSSCRTESKILIKTQKQMLEGYMSQKDNLLKPFVSNLRTKHSSKTRKTKFKKNALAIHQSVLKKNSDVTASNRKQSILFQL